MKTLLSFCLLLLVFSCNKDEVKIQRVPPHLKQMLPYKNGQTVTFIDDLGAELRSDVSVDYGISERSNCAGCEVSERIEYVTIEFTTSNLLRDNIHFIRMSADVRPIVFLTIASPQDQYQIGNGFDFETEKTIAQPLCNASRQKCIGTITLNGTVYNDVLEIISGATDDRSITKAYYTVAKGLIGFKYGSGRLFSLKQ